MPFVDSQETVDALLGGYKFTPIDLEQFVRNHQDEDQYLEYKDGKITGRASRKEANKEIRHAVSGFANSEGGVLIVGVAEGRPRAISPCEATGNEPLDKWAEGLLHDMAPFFSPLPRIHVVAHSLGPVLVIVTARAPALVPCVELGQIKYFLRLNQSTLPAPDFLLSDLVLGRRRQPAFDVSAYIEQPPPLPREDKSNTTIFVGVENIGLVTTEGLGVGVVSWVPGNTGPDINRHLMSYLEHPDRVHLGGYGWILQHSVCTPIDPRMIKLSPFSKSSFKTDLLLLFSATQLELTTAIYVITNDAPPAWFEFAFRCGRRDFTNKPYVDILAIKRVMSRRAQVKAENITIQAVNPGISS
jgi:hypothetical protein